MTKMTQSDAQTEKGESKESQDKVCDPETGATELSLGRIYSQGQKNLNHLFISHPSPDLESILGILSVRWE